MKLHRFAAVFVLALLAAVPAMAAKSLLTPNGVRYAVESTPDRPQVEITRAEGIYGARLVVPSTDDATPESQAQIAYDALSDLLFVVWTRENSYGAEVRYAALDASGQWSTPRNIAAGSSMYRGLQVAVTQSDNSETSATLLHMSWWSINGNVLDPEYALVAFEDGLRVSAQVANLEEMAALGDGVNAAEFEELGEAIHPPLTMERALDGVDLVFGSVQSTAVTRINVVPRRIGGNVRIWKPVGRTSTRTPRSQLVATDSEPVRAMIRNGRVALYVVGEHFRYVVLNSDNTWTPLHSVQVNEDNPASELVDDLRTVVEEHVDTPDGSTAGGIAIDSF